MVKTETPENLRDGWLMELRSLIGIVETWARELDWSARQVEKKMEDPQVGRYQAPALLLQKETTRVLMEPIARKSPGNEGLVDLYLLPAYDDIASLYDYDGGWHVHYSFPGRPILTNAPESEQRPLSKELFRQVREDMVSHAT